MRWVREPLTRWGREPLLWLGVASAILITALVFAVIRVNDANSRQLDQTDAALEALRNITLEFSEVRDDLIDRMDTLRVQVSALQDQLEELGFTPIVPRDVRHPEQPNTGPGEAAPPSDPGKPSDDPPESPRPTPRDRPSPQPPRPSPSPSPLVSLPTPLPVPIPIPECIGIQTPFGCIIATELKFPILFSLLLSVVYG